MAKIGKLGGRFFTSTSWLTFEERGDMRGHTDSAGGRTGCVLTGEMHIQESQGTNMNRRD